jgi:DUF917 family protein
MKKGSIKVVKRNKKDAAEKTQAVADAAEAESVGQGRIVNVIKDWISERRETSRAEKVFSDDKISEWK